jgi:5'-3' exonuclease
VDIIVEVLAALGVARVGVRGFEADDILGTLARAMASPELPVEVVTGDRDLIQLVDDARRIQVLYIGRGIRRLQVLDEATVQNTYGIRADQYVDFSILRGDPSDGLPGISGIGEKSAAALLTTYGDLAGLRAAVAEGAPIRPAMAAAIRAGADYLDRAGEVVRVATAPLPEVDARMPIVAADSDALTALVSRWGIGASVERFLEAMSGH